MKHWTDQYLAFKWSSSFDCWSFARKVIEEQSSKLLPKYSIPPLNHSKGCAKALCAGLKEWSFLDQPKHLCLVALSKNSKFIHHVGVFISEEGGMIMHNNQDSNVSIESISDLRSKGWNRIEFYDYCH